MHNKRRIFPILLILILITIGGWYLFQTVGSQNGDAIQASGRVETVELVVSSELAGRVLEVHSEKGDHVSAGDALFRLDDELLNSQRERAARALESAQANQENAQTGLEMAQATLKVAEANYEAVLANTEAELAPVEQALAELYENADLIRARNTKAYGNGLLHLVLFKYLSTHNGIIGTYLFQNSQSHSVNSHPVSSRDDDIRSFPCTFHGSAIGKDLNAVHDNKLRIVSKVYFSYHLPHMRFFVQFCKHLFPVNRPYTQLH